MFLNLWTVSEDMKEVIEVRWRGEDHWSDVIAWFVNGGILKCGKTDVIERIRSAYVVSINPHRNSADVREEISF